MSSYSAPTSVPAPGGYPLLSVMQPSAQSRIPPTAASSAASTSSNMEVPILGQMETLLKTLNDPAQRDDLKLKALQEISDHFEVLITTSAYPALMDSLLRIFIKLLQETTPQFIGENNTQQLRKLMLEIVHRMPCNEHMKIYASTINKMLFKLIETENEENVLVCLRIVIELEKQFRPAFIPEVQQFLAFVKSMYRDLPMYVHNIFEPHPSLQIAEIQHLDIENALQTAFTVVHIQTQQKLPDGGSVVYTLLPRGKQSLKVLAELPIIVVLLYQVHKQAVQQEVAEFIPLVLNTIILAPTPQQRNDTRFNRDIFIDFMAAQIKALSFIAFLGRVYQDAVNMQASSLVKGIITLLASCPHEIAHLRKELMVATRHILGTELRMKFIPYIGQLFEENLLVGSGWTANENLRPLAYSTLADLVHHVRQQLPIQSLTSAVYLFARCAHDPTISCGIQTMACKLLLNLVDSISKQQETGLARDLLLFMLGVFVRKFKVVATDYLPQMFEKCEKRRFDPLTSSVTASGNSDLNLASARQSLTFTNVETPSGEGKSSIDAVFSDTEQKDPESESKQLAALMHSTGEKEEKFHFGSQQSSAVFSLADARALVKTLVCGVKTITWGICAGRVTGNDQTFSQARHLQPRDTALFVRLLRYGLQSLDVYMISPATGSNAWQKRQHTSIVQSKDEKDVLDHFATLFTLLNLQTFKEIFSTNIDFLVERISENLALQAVPHAFLINVNTSPAFATILIDYLIKRLAVMGSHEEQSNLCLKLYKTVFGSVSLFAAENEQMLKPHLHRLVNSCLEMSLTAKEPYNYFLLLRGLFRSIGGGSHDLLYQEFLPLLPGLLKHLNSLQNGYHRQQMKELLVELCLTVPVRLSSLVPHLPMLMEPLVSALSGSPSLVLQGLRTLELCIDNLQPEFLHEHMAPVRPQMMQALAKILNTTGNDQAAMAAWRTVGKLGGLNRKMLTDMQPLNYSQHSGAAGPLLPLTYVEGSAVVEIPISKAIQYACTILKQSSTDLQVRLRCLRMIRAFLVSLVTQPERALLDSSEKWLYARFRNAEPIAVSSIYRCQDTVARTCCVDALTAVLHAATAKDTRQEALPFVNTFVRYLTFLALCEQTGTQALKEQSYYNRSYMDSGIISDAIVTVMADEDKELCKAGILAVTIVLDTTSSLFGSKDKAPQLPLLREISKGVVQLCYEPAWYAKLGGCSGIKYLLENFPSEWVSRTAGVLVEALLYVVVDSMGQIANGALDIAKLDLELLAKTLCQLESQDEREKAMFAVVQATIPCLSSWSSFAREEATRLLEMIAESTGTSAIQLILPHMTSSVLDFLGIPKGAMNDFTIHCRIGILAAFTYLVSDQLPDTKFDPCGESERRVFAELVSILEGDRAIAQAVPGYEKEAEMSLTQLKIHAANAILSWKDIREFRERTFTSLFKTLTSDVPELQETAYQCLQKFVLCASPETDMLHTAMRPLLLLLSDFKSLTLNVAKKLLYLTKLFPTTFNEKLCDQLLAHLKKWLEVAAASPPPKAMQQFVSPEMETCAVIVEIFHHIPAASARFVDPLVTVLAKAEAAMNIEVGSPWRNALLKFLVKYPAQTVEFFLMESNLKDEHMANMFLWILKQEAAKQCRDVLQNNPVLLINILSTYGANREAALLPQEKHECVILRLVCILANRDRTWLPKNLQLVDYLRALWNTPEFRTRHAEDSCDTHRLKAAKSVVRCLFYYFQANVAEIGLLYDMLSCFTEKFSAEFEWLKKYLDKDVASGFSIEWKRHAFMLYLDIYGNPNLDVRFKTKILQYVIIPCVQRTFEKGEIDQLIGSTPAPEVDSDDNLVSAFLLKVIDTIDTQRLNALPDILLILFYQLTCLFVEYAAPHIHDTNSKKQGARLRKVMLFGWPCLQQNNSLDPSARYYGHLLIAHIIEKFAINRKIVLQVFHSLLKAHGQEARHVVRHALNILTPAVPQRMEDGHAQLAQFAKKLIVEEGHSTPQLIHILQVVIRHYKLFFVVRHQLLQHLVNAMQKLVLQAGTAENKKLAVDVCETVIKWELMCLKKDDGDPNESYDEAVQSAISKAEGQSEEGTRRIDKPIVETTLNFLLRLACYVPDQSAAAQNAAAGVASMETLSKRCLHLLKVALKPDLWGLKAELKLQWLEKALASAVNDQSQNAALACTCLDVLTYLISVLPPPQVLNSVRSIQRGITFCLGCQNHQVVKSLYNFLAKLLGIFHSEIPPLGSIDSFDLLGQSLQKMLYDTFSNYEKVPALGLNGIYGAVTLLKAACSVDPMYVERVLLPFVKALQKLAREHVGSTNPEITKSSADMLSLCLDLVRPRVEAMNADLRKQFLQNVLYILLEKSNNAKVISSIMKHLSDWMELGPTAAPPLRERQALLLKLSQSVEKKFASDNEIMKSFLELVYFVYRNDQLRTTELPSKLESAFLLGLCQSEAEIRSRFFDIFDGSIRKFPYDRLYYIMCTQNWEPLQQHYWAKQCIELMLAVVDRQRPLALKSASYFPRISTSDQQSIVPMDAGIAMKIEPPDAYSQTSAEATSDSQEIIDFDNGQVSAWSSTNTMEQLRNVWQKQIQFLQSIRNVTVADMLPFFIELCHQNTELAESVWISLLKSTFAILDDGQRQNLTNEIVPFLCSGSHLAQRSCNPSVLRSFVEAFSLCSPAIFIKPSLLQYLGRTHGLWHRSILLLEKSLDSIPPNVSLDSTDDPASAEKLEIFDSLCELYSSLNEQDLWASIWFQRARYPDTKNGLRYEQLGVFDQSADVLERAMIREQMELSTTMMNLNIFQEMRLWEQHWIKCMQELNQWESLKDLATAKSVQEPFLLLECAWRLPNWNLMKEALVQVENSYSKELAWKVALYRGYYAVGICEDQHSNNLEKITEQANQLLIKEWRRQPKILSQSHAPLLQAAQQVMELQEAAQLLNTMQAANHNRPPNIHEMKSVVKTWRNRVPAVFDSLSHWSHVFSWRLHHYKTLVNTLENDPHQSQSSLLGVHASAQCLLQYAKTARRRGMLQLAADTLNRLHTIPNLPIIDGFQKLREQVKCCLRAAAVNAKGADSYHGSAQGGLDIIENSNVSFFNKETSADLYALKGMLLSQMNRWDEATKSFSTSLQLNDGSYRTWGAWSDHLEVVYSRDRDPGYASQAVICAIQAARLVPELKARKFLVRIFWLLKFDVDGIVSMESFSKFALSIPPLNWLFWLPQLIGLLKETNNATMIEILINIGKAFPEAVLLAIYPYLGVENSTDWMKADGNWQGKLQRILAAICDAHPCVAATIYKIVTEACLPIQPLQMINNFPQHWSEKALTELRMLLQECYRYAFENRNDVQGTGLSSAIVERLARVRNIFTCESDELAVGLGNTFGAEFDASVTSVRRLSSVVGKRGSGLVKWCEIMETRTSHIPKTFMLPEINRYLASFCSKMSLVDMFGETLTPRMSQYCVKISKFLPRVETVHRADIIARRFWIRGSNGKKYPFLLVPIEDICQFTAQQRILQLFRVMNVLLTKNKEVACRLLQFDIPNVIPLGPNHILLSDKESNILMLDFLKQHCKTKDVTVEDLVARYYEKLLVQQARGSPPSQQLLLSIMKDISLLIPKSALTSQIAALYPEATDFFTFRKQVCLHSSVLNSCEYLLNLAPVGTQNLVTSKETGFTHVEFFVPDSKERMGEYNNRPVPFRLTPALVDFFGVTLHGYMAPAMTALSRCLQQQQLHQWLRVLLWENDHQQDGDGQNRVEKLMTDHSKAVAVLTSRLQALSQLENVDGRCHALIAAACSMENLCRMDPAWHPWF